MQGNPMVSVIVCCYMNFEGIFQTLDSIFEQDYDNIELIIADDGSDNYEIEIPMIKQYIDENKRPNIKSVIYSRLTKNLGTVKNCNAALKKATGKYIKFLSPKDDFYDSKSLSSFIVFMKNNHYKIVEGKSWSYHYETGDYIGDVPNSATLACVNYADAAKQLSWQLNRHSFVSSVALLFEKELLEEQGFFDERFRLIEDYPFLIKTFQEGIAVRALDQYMMKYDVSGMSRSREITPVVQMFLDDNRRIDMELVAPVLIAQGKQKSKVLRQIKYRNDYYDALRQKGVSKEKIVCLQFRYFRFTIPKFLWKLRTQFYGKILLKNGDRR